MAARFQTKNQHGGRMTPSNAGSNSASTATTTSNTVPASPGTYNTSGESDQAFLGKKKKSLRKDISLFVLKPY